MRDIIYWHWTTESSQVIEHENIDITNPAAILLPNKATFLLPNPQPVRLLLEKLDQLELRQAVHVKLDLCHGK